MFSRVAIMLCATTAGACVHRAPQPITVDEVRQLVHACGMTGWVEFEMAAPDQIAMTRLDPNANFDGFKCVTRGLRKRGIKLGFYGREQINP